ncbi:hypothetical protein [Arthrobacter sp. HS15c]|uniref:hypothetical protein n=1 Tax=Arthrobacter sp. HS15c TaxID=3230279 RepID=UPI0034652862
MDRNDISEEELKDAVIHSLSAQLVADGLIDPSGLSKYEYKAAALAALRRLKSEGAEFYLIVDHKDSVLEQAKEFAEAGKADFAIMFYAMWIEHWLNGMYVWKSTSRGAPQEEVVGQLRNSSMKQKLTSKWNTAFGDELPANWVHLMLDIAGHRNDYVHYKWRVQGEFEELSKMKDMKIELLRKAEWIVGELESLEHQMVYGGFPHI